MDRMTYIEYMRDIAGIVPPVNLDTDDVDYLVTFAAVADGRPRSLGRYLFPDRPAYYVHTTRDLGHYAFNRSIALYLEANRDTERANVYWSICGHIYSRLREYARW